MTCQEAVKAAKNPQEALLAIAGVLDLLVQGITEIHTNLQYGQRDAWDHLSWSEENPTHPMAGAKRSQAWLETATEIVRDGGRAAEVIESDDGTTDVVILPPTEERKAKRRQFERQSLKLTEYLGDGEDWTEVYAKGGPMWLYLGNRDLVMSYPESTRAAMVADVLEDSPKDAEEMGRDVLKQAGEDGPGGVAMRANDSIVNVP